MLFVILAAMKDTMKGIDLNSIEEELLEEFNRKLGDSATETRNLDVPIDSSGK